MWPLSVCTVCGRQERGLGPNLDSAVWSASSLVVTSVATALSRLSPLPRGQPRDAVHALVSSLSSLPASPPAHMGSCGPVLPTLGLIVAGTVQMELCLVRHVECQCGPCTLAGALGVPLGTCGTSQPGAEVASIPSS